MLRTTASDSHYYTKTHQIRDTLLVCVSSSSGSRIILASTFTTAQAKLTLTLPILFSAYLASDRAHLHRAAMVETSGVQLDPINADTGVGVNDEASTQLRHITAQATLKYSVKDYNTAADLYSKATELQAEINGELSLENADLLYAYGRCLYHVAVRNSDVLGSNITGEKSEEGHKPGSKKQNKQKLPDEADEQHKSIVEGIVTKVVEKKNGPNQPSEKADMRSKPYFQFTGDENFDTSDEEEEEGVDAAAMKMMAKRTPKKKMTLSMPMRYLTWRACSC